MLSENRRRTIAEMSRTSFISKYRRCFLKHIRSFEWWDVPIGRRGRLIRTTLVHPCYSENMAVKNKTSAPRSVRQSVTIPATLAADVRRVAKERHVTMSRALVVLAERGVRAEREAKEQLKTAYRKFIEEAEPERKNEAGRDLIRAVFGKNSIAEDSIF